jgi:hypothetical protein
MSHTPGPWTIEHETEDGEPYDDGVRIDSLEGPVAFNVIECSAPLIAAAPELLYQLKQAVSLIVEKDLFDWEDATSGNSFQDMEDAIRLAEGRD